MIAWGISAQRLTTSSPSTLSPSPARNCSPHSSFRRSTDSVSPSALSR